MKTGRLFVFTIIVLFAITLGNVTFAYTGHIAYVSDRDGQNEIYLMEIDGSNQTRLTDSVYDDITPVFSPDGQKIAFFSNRNGSYRIYTMNWDGTGIYEIPNSECAIGTWAAGRGLAWSPDGQKLLFKPSNNSLATINLDGSGKTIIWDGAINGHDYIQGVEWGPTINDIYVNAQNPWWGYDQHIFHKTNDGWIQITADVQPFHSHGPQVSPEISRIVFDRQEDWEGPVNIYTMDLNGEDMVKLTFDTGYRVVNYAPDWIDNGNGIVFCSGYWDVSSWGPFQIRVMDATGANLQMLQGEGSNFAPSWTPITPIQQVTIDIKPGSYPNAINLGSQGLVPVAILSSEEFDANSVDPDTVELAGADVEVRGKSNRFMAHEEDVDGDGLLDLVVQVATANLDPNSLQDGYAVLTGKTFDGQDIKGQDEITIVPPEK